MCVFYLFAVVLNYNLNLFLSTNNKKKEEGNKHV